MSNNKPNLGRETLSTFISIPSSLEQEHASQFKDVLLIYNDSASNAVLRSLSDNGAEIETEEELHLPDTFIIKSPCGGFIKTCYQIWQDGNYIGVTFKYHVYIKYKKSSNIYRLFR
ncbi:MAG: hypothetical protein COA69_04525 [Robiginitomaculum sp.]|nr:MAG: hypothetical protein COA69_04525 [Robiginitomaculum sp.]